MKPLSFVSLLVGLTGISAGSEGPVMRDAATHDQIVVTYQKAVQNDPMAKMLPSTGADPSIVNQPGNLMSRSEVISFNGFSTLVPKRAVLRKPPALESRLKFQPGSKFVPWLEFYTQNRGWITTVEVSRVQAEGNQAMAEDVSERIGKSLNLVVATYQTGPISVLPLKTSEEIKPDTQQP